MILAQNNPYTRKYKFWSLHNTRLVSCAFFLSLNLITHIHVHSYSTNQQGILDNAVPVLLVDGYNVCGYWMKLKKHFVKGRLDIAHQKLIDELLTFSMLRGLFLFHYSATLFLTSFIFFFHLYRGQNYCCLCCNDVWTPHSQGRFRWLLFSSYHTMYSSSTISVYLNILYYDFRHFAVLISFSQVKHVLIHGLKKRLDISTLSWL